MYNQSCAALIAKVQRCSTYETYEEGQRRYAHHPIFYQVPALSADFILYAFDDGAFERSRLSDLHRIGRADLRWGFASDHADRGKG